MPRLDTTLTKNNQLNIAMLYGWLCYWWYEVFLGVYLVVVPKILSISYLD